LVRHRADTPDTNNERRRAMLVLSDQAQQVIKGIIDDSEVGPDGGLRITGSNDEDGEAGLEFGVASGAEDGDETVSAGGANVFLDETAAEVLADKTLDVEAHGDHFHFSLGEQDEDAAAAS
jgi:iron-sulfur cluster assembly protein